MFNVTERVRTGLHLLDSDNVNSLTSPLSHFECLLATSAACLSSVVDEKLIELVCKYKSLFSFPVTLPSATDMHILTHNFQDLECATDVFHNKW
jgi:hypothetical protein